MNDKKFETIPLRLELLKTLIGKSKITPLTEITHADHPSKLLRHNDHECSLNSNCVDITCVLKKKLVNIVHIFTKWNGTLEYIKSGTTGHTFKGTANIDGKIINFAMKVVPYPIKETYGDLFDIRRPENAELTIIKLLSWFITTKQSPHIVLPIGTFNIDLKKFVALTKDKIKGCDKYDAFIDKCKSKEYYPVASVLIGEWANGGDLLDYLKKNYKKMDLVNWQVLFFQIISTLAVIQEMFHKFRHNDLKANNLLINLHKPHGRKFTIYHIKNQYFILPDLGFSVKLWDFDFACIPGLADNAKVYADWTTDINIEPVKNRYYDMHYFFNTLTKKAFLPKIMTAPEIPEEVVQFIKRIVPKKYSKLGTKYVAERGRILVDEEYVLPIDVILKDDFFANLRFSNKSYLRIREEFNKDKKKQTVC
jgi:serine/threonine protein kinase